MTFLRTLILLIIASSAAGQSFEYSFSSPYLSDSGVVLNWVIISGSTCDGMVVEHATDTNQFSRIYQVSGTCGSANFDVPYRFVHQEPEENQINYYRIRFGQVELSEIKEIRAFQSSVIVYPNPASTSVRFLLDNPERNSHTIHIYNSEGKLLLSSEGQDLEFYFDISGLQRGLYYYQVEGEKISTSGKIMRK